MATAVIHIVVGGNRGIGLEIVRRLLEGLQDSKDPTAIVVTCRDAEEGLRACVALKKEMELGDSVQLRCMGLDVTKEESIDKFSEELGEMLPVDKSHAIKLIHNAGFAFSVSSTEPFAQQAAVTCGINYFGAVHLIRKLLPQLQAAQASSGACRVVYVSSGSGESAHASLSESLRQRLERIVASGTEAELDQFVRDFVAAAQDGNHQEAGFPGSAYGLSKCALTAHARLLNRTLNPSGDSALPVVSCCPGFCRTGMTLKNPLSPVSWLFFAASWIVGQSAYAGADTPVWLALEAEPQQVGGRFVRNRIVQS